MQESRENPEERRSIRERLRYVVEEVRDSLVRDDVSPDEKENFREELARIMVNPNYQEYGDPD